MLTAAERLHEATSVNIRHAKRCPDGKWQQERGKFYVLQKSKDLSKNWRSFVGGDKKGEIVWNPGNNGSLPHGDQRAAREYREWREVIKAGDALCSSVTLTYNLGQTQTAMRDGGKL